MKKRIIASTIILILLCTIIGVIISCNHPLTASGQNNNYSKEELEQLIIENQSIKQNASIMAQSARELGWTDDDKLIKELKNKWTEANKLETKYQKLLNEIYQKEEAERIAERQLEEAKWAEKAAQYPAATQIWRYMKAQGWNDYVCAGIMGNLMTEVGGQTLDIRYTLSSSGYYGMCQWNRAYSNIWGAGLESQCDYLRDTIKYEFDTYGFNYQKGFNFNAFLNMNDCKAAALAFSKCYERCSSASYSIRQDNAIKAYNYFVN